MAVKTEGTATASNGRPVALRQQRGLALWSRWVLANAMSGSISGFAIYYLLSTTGGGIVGTLVGTTGAWTVVGAAQWLVLQGYVPKGRVWILATVIGGVAGTLLGGWILVGWLGLLTSVTTSPAIAIGVVGAVAGAVLGLAQWRVLRFQIRNANGWLLASIAAGIIGWVVGWSSSAIFGLLTGSAAGWAAGSAVTGLALGRLLHD